MCMRYKTLVTLAVGALTILPVTAQAQVHVSLGGGLTVPNSEVKDHLGNGFNFNFGVEVKVTPVIGIEGLYSFNGLGDKRISIPVSGTPGGSSVPTDFFAGMNMQYGTANLVVQKPDGAIRPYGLVGMGVYYRPIEVTTPERGLRARILQSVVVRVLPGPSRSRRECRRRTQLYGLRDGLRRRPELRGVLRGDPLSLYLGSDCSHHGTGAAAARRQRRAESQRSVPGHHIRFPLLERHSLLPRISPAAAMLLPFEPAWAPIHARPTGGGTPRQTPFSAAAGANREDTAVSRAESLTLWNFAERLSMSTKLVSFP